MVMQSRSERDQGLLPSGVRHLTCLAWLCSEMEDYTCITMELMCLALILQGPDEFLTTEEALLIEVAQIVVKSGAILGSDSSPCSLSGGCSG